MGCLFILIQESKTGIFFRWLVAHQRITFENEQDKPESNNYCRCSVFNLKKPRKNSGAQSKQLVLLPFYTYGSYNISTLLVQGSVGICPVLQPVRKVYIFTHGMYIGKVNKETFVAVTQATT